MGVQFKHNNDNKSGISCKEVVKKYKGKGGYSAEGLEQRVTYYIKIMFIYELQGCTEKIQCR